MEVYVIYIEDEFGEREVGPQFVLETNANAYVERLRKQFPTKSVWMERKRTLPRASLPIIPVSKVK
jgi:hypothetical protein